MTADVDLVADELVVTARIMSASNATLVGTIGDVQVVYKPVAGEQPLWDFPDGTLAERELAAYLVSETLGWEVVPPTWLRDGPAGVGMVQQWCEPDPEQEAVTLVPAGRLPDGWHHVLDGLDAEDHPISLIHEDSTALRRMAVFDVVTNNADRKGGHVLEMPGGHRFGVDHGLTFHEEHKLRTVLWGWVDEPLTDDEVAGVTRVREGLAGELGDQLSDLLRVREIDALANRCDRLLADPRFPTHRGGMPAVPWPPF